VNERAGLLENDMYRLKLNLSAAPILMLLRVNKPCLLKDGFLGWRSNLSREGHLRNLAKLPLVEAGNSMSRAWKIVIDAVE